MTHMLLTSFLLILGCSSSQIKNNNADPDFALKSDKVLIVYLSRQIIQRQLQRSFIKMQAEHW
jgi:hypothetical protein